jgi:hypothetical protein
MTEKELNLEEEILNATKTILINGIKSLDGYNNPTKSIVNLVIKEYEPSISILFKDAIEKTIRSDNFKEELQKLISQRIVRELVSQSESSIARIVQKMKQDETFRARLTLAVDNIVTEFTTKD